MGLRLPERAAGAVMEAVVTVAAAMAAAVADAATAVSDGDGKTAAVD